MATVEICIKFKQMKFMKYTSKFQEFGFQGYAEES